MKKTKLITLAALALSAFACKPEKEASLCLVPVTVQLNDFSISQEDFPETKSVAIGNYSGVKALTLAFYDADGAELFKSTQIKSDETSYDTFGLYSCLLPVGSHTLVAIGYGSDYAITLNGPRSASFTADKVRETFAITQQINITSTDNHVFGPVLNRVITKLAVQSTDPRPANATSVRVTFAKGSKSFSPESGLASSDEGLVNVVDISSAVGSASLTNSYLFLSSDEQTMNVTIETLDSEGSVIVSKTVDDVPLKRNRVTTLSGRIYTAPADISFEVESTYRTEYEMQF
mgnify:FL=1